MFRENERMNKNCGSGSGSGSIEELGRKLRVTSAQSVQCPHQSTFLHSHVPQLKRNNKRKL